METVEVEPKEQAESNNNLCKGPEICALYEHVDELENNERIFEIR